MIPMEAHAIDNIQLRWRQAALRSGSAKKVAPAPVKQAEEQKPAPAVVAVPPLVVASSRYVRIPVAAAMTGLSETSIERKIERGIWVEGKHYRRRDGGIYIDMEAYKRWVEEGK